MSTKHEEISRVLRDEILAGRFGVGGRIPSEAQLVRRFGVSRPTVGRALQTLGEENLIERRAGSGTFVREAGGRPGNVVSSSLALLVPDLGNTEIFQAIAGEIASLARVHDYNLVWGGSAQPKLDSDTSLNHGKELCEQFIASRVSGVFFTPYELVPGKEEGNRQIATDLREAGVPVVLLDRDLTPFPGRSGFDLVGTDNFAGGFLLGEHLVKLGCRDVRFVTRPGSAPTVQARIAGVREALGRHGVVPRPGWVGEGEPADARFVSKLMRKPVPEAVVCANDHTAALLLQVLSRRGAVVPRDLRVVGFDDVRFSTLVSPPLTTVAQPCREIAVAAFALMMELQADPTLPPRHVTLTPRLVVRDSCGAYST
jgi:LacI family transcriptional regulator